MDGATLQGFVVTPLKERNRKIKTMKLPIHKLLTLTSLLLCGMIPSYGEEGDDVYFVNNPNAEKYAVILVGASASEEYEAKFFSWATHLRDSLVSEYGYQEDKVTMLLGNKPKDFGGLATLGACRVENIESLVNQLSNKVEASDQLTIFLFGHGTGFGEESKFNIAGPDINGTQFGALLSVIKARSVIVINSTSASYDFSSALAGPGRVVLSATRSSAEKYDTKFPEYLLEGIQGHRADRDKNQRLSVLEAFMFAQDRVQNFFRDEGRLASEHSALDDNADGIFSTEPSAKQNDGRLAEIAYLDAGLGESRTLTSSAAQIKTKMDNLERSVFLLRGQKTEMSEAQYWQRMEPLLIELAQSSRSFASENNGAK